MAILDEIKEAVVDGETDEIEELVQQAIDEGIDPNVIINEGLIGGMDIVAPLFRDGEMFVPEVMESADCMKIGTDLLKPLLGDEGMETKGKVVIGTIDGDLHDIGKNLVVLMLESNGYELINTSRKEVNEAVDARDESVIRNLARKQADAGATYIDVNCGSRVHDELEVMEWLVNIVQDEVDTPICFDSPNHEALRRGLEVYKGTDSMINSISGEDGRYETIIPLVKDYNTKIVLLCMDSSGMPETADDRMKVVDALYAKLKADGIDDDRMFFDALVKPVSSITAAGLEVLNTNRRIKDKYPETHQILGLSNISYGLPKRARLNRVFTVMTMTEGVDGYIIDPTNQRTMADIITATTLLGQDNYCKKYIKANRKGFFDID